MGPGLRESTTHSETERSLQRTGVLGQVVEIGKVDKVWRG